MTVRCSKYKDCGNKDCMHYAPHQPMWNDENGGCSTDWMACPLVKPLVICLPVEDSPAKGG